MNILRITTRLYPDTGGPAKQAYLLSEFCSTKRIRTHVIACKSKDSPYQKRKIINPHYYIYYLPFIAPGINSSLITQLKFLFRFLIYGFIKAVHIIRENKISIIHGHSPTPTGLLVYLLSKLFKIPYVYTIHGLDYPNSFSLTLDLNLTVKNSKKTISVNRRIKNFIQDQLNLNNVIWFPNSINLNNFFHVSSLKEKKDVIQNANLESILNEDDYIISYIGHMIFQQKVQGMVDFLNAFQKFFMNLKFQEKQKIKLIYIGSGKYSYLLKNQINKLNLNKNVFLLGERNDVNNILAISDLLGLTSYIEGFPNVVLEAMASRVPCIVSNVGEIEHMIGEYGYIVEPGGLNEMQGCLEDCYNAMDEKRKALMENVYQYVKNKFNIDLIGKKLIKLYLDILKTSGS